MRSVGPSDRERGRQYRLALVDKRLLVRRVRGGLDGGNEPCADPYAVGAGVENATDVVGRADSAAGDDRELGRSRTDARQQLEQRHRRSHVPACLDALYHDKVDIGIDRRTSLVFGADLPGREAASRVHLSDQATVGLAPEPLDEPSRSGSGDGVCRCRERNEQVDPDCRARP